VSTLLHIDSRIRTDKSYRSRCGDPNVVASTSAEPMFVEFDADLSDGQDLGEDEGSYN
jgi:hypothetical protein